MKAKIVIITVLLLLLISYTALTADSKAKPDAAKKHHKKTITFSGYLQGWFMADFTEESSSSSFLVKRARLTARSKLTKRVSIKVMADFAKTENILMDAYADIKIVDNLSLRFGQHKTPFSRVNLRSGSDLYLTERPFYHDYITPPIRDIGLQASYSNSKFQLIGGIYNGEGRTKADSDGIKHICLRGILKAIPNLDIGANIYISHKEVGFEGDHLRMYGIDFHYKFSQFFLEGEIVKKQVTLIGALTGTAYYLMGGAQFNSKGTIKVEPVIRYEYIDARAPFLGVQEWQLLGGFNLYNDSKNVKLSLNGGHIDGGTFGESYNKFRLQLQLSF